MGQENADLKPFIIFLPRYGPGKKAGSKAFVTNIDKMLVILPFEKDFFHKWDYETEYVGHPLVEVIEQFKKSPEAGIAAGNLLWQVEKRCNSPLPLIALLPGSRKQEILKKLPVMLEASRQFPDFQFVVAEAPGQDPAFYDEVLKNYPQAGRVRNQTYSLLHACPGGLRYIRYGHPGNCIIRCSGSDLL